MKPMTTQLTFQGLLDTLAAVPQDATVKLAGFGSADTPGVLFRHRPFVDGLAITPTFARAALQTTAAEYADVMRRTGPGLSSSYNRPGYEDQHLAGADTPMWVSLPYEVSFNAVTGVEMVKDFAVIRSINLAPVQGPTIQRIPDEEAILRLRKVDEHLHGESKPLNPKAEKWLINYVARDRTPVRLNLEEARWELANFEASLQAKRDRVAKLEADVARNDYLLGITDEFTG